ncbi:MAG: ribosome silencing factor [Candidatus Brocadiales bacterium]
MQNLASLHGSKEGEKNTIDPKEVAIYCAQLADEKKAADIVVLDVGKLTFIADCFVICSGINKRQLQSIANDIEGKLTALGIHRLGIEGLNDAKWVLLDYGEVIVHLFDKETRMFYDLELLWGDAPKVKWQSKKLLFKV